MNKEEPEYFTIIEASEYIGISRAIIYDWIKVFEIQKHTFVRNQKIYIHINDVKRLKAIKEEPWIAGNKKTPKEQ